MGREGQGPGTTNDDEKNVSCQWECDKASVIIPTC